MEATDWSYGVSVQAMAEMPRYRCHKEVWAAKITSIDPRDDRSFIISLDCAVHPQIIQSNEWIKKHGPKIGGYYVVYKDGYQSYSPAEAFEEGYTRI